MSGDRQMSVSEASSTKQERQSLTAYILGFHLSVYYILTYLPTYLLL
jgi:heme/copper-type cytochrome/quinol oxidase subunit 4